MWRQHSIVRRLRFFIKEKNPTLAILPYDYYTKPDMVSLEEFIKRLRETHLHLPFSFWIQWCFSYLYPDKGECKRCRIIIEKEKWLNEWVRECEKDGYIKIENGKVFIVGDGREIWKWSGFAILFLEKHGVLVSFIFGGHRLQ